MAKKLKRGNNEGSISLRPDGRWVARVSLGFKNGKPQRKAFYGATRQEAAEKLTTALRTHQQGISLPNERKTVEWFLNTWLETVSGKVRPSTLRSYTGIVKNHLIPGLGRIPLVKLSPHQVAQFLKQQHTEGRIPSKVKSQKEVESKGVSAEHLRRVLRAALNQAIKWDLVPRNAASLASAPKSAKHEIKFLDPAQAKEFFHAVKGDRYEALFTVAIAIGLRLGEALGLRWTDINFEGGMLTVRRQVQRVNGKLAFVEPKTSSARRSIPLPAFALEALKDLKMRQELEDIPVAGSRWKDHGLVFASGIGTPCDERNIRRSLYAILKANNLPPLRFHDLRHSCATLLLSQGTDVRTIMQTLGHSQITLTLNTYSHVIPALQREAADRMEELFRRAGP